MDQHPNSLLNLRPYKKGEHPTPHTKKHPNGYLTPLLKKFLEKKINYEDPETKAIIRGKVKDAILWRLLLNAAQGDNTAIGMILERLDGKVVQQIAGEIDHYHNYIEGIVAKAGTPPNRIAEYASHSN